MDQVHMQETVMDNLGDNMNSSNVAGAFLQPPLETGTPDHSLDTSDAPPLQLVNGGNDDAAPSSEELNVVQPGASEPAPQKQAPTYDELFPALPSSDSTGASASLAATAPAARSGWGAAVRNSNENMRIQSSVITQVFHVPQEERAKLDVGSQFGESASSSICTDISKKTGAHIEISSAKDQSLTFLVTGKSDAVIKARKMVLDKFQAQNKQRINIPKEHHKFLLGKKGKKLQELEQNTGTKIQVPSVSEASDVVIVSGTRECIEKAFHEMRILSDEQSKQAYESISVPKMYHPFVCGGNNSNLQSMIKEHGVRINVPPLSVQKDEITITGEKESVLAVKDKIAKIHKTTERRCQALKVEVSKAQHKHVIGQRGANIAEILELHNVSVEVPPVDVPSDTITLRGPQEKLGAALTMVYDKASSMVKADVYAPCWLHRYIIGKKGANINKVTQEHPSVHVLFTDKSEVINLEGPRDEVEKAQDSLESMIKEMQSRLVQEELRVDPKFHKHIIGKSGANINRIRNENNVIINIEPDSSSVIKLEGTPESVQQVKEELEQLVKKMENEKEREIKIESRLHRSIIGTRGESIREIREKFNEVQISFPDPGQKSDIVKIRGPKEDVDACFKHLQKVAKDLLENNYQVKVPIFQQYLKFIIGKNGANINKIRSETDTRISPSSNDEGGDEIVIVGKRENCEKAKERIMQIQNEQANIVEMDIIVPSKFHNSIIGQRGRLIRSISEECGGVAIKFPPPEKKSDKVTIRGPKEDVIKAKKILVDLSNERQLASFSAEVRCRQQHHKFLIGKNGATISKVREDTGARIIFPSDKDDDKEVITIIGKKEQVAAARAHLEATIKELNNIVERTVNVPRAHHQHFIQRRGELLRQLADQFGGVSISFPRNGADSEVVTLKGGVECVEGAKARMLEIVKELQSQVSIEVVIPQCHHRTVMGPRGSTLQSVQAEHNVDIKFPDRATPEELACRREEEQMDNNEVRHYDIVRVRGLPAACEAAKQALLDLVPVTDEVTIPYKYHRYIIGQRGQAIRALMTEHDVNIQVPPSADHSDIIRVVGVSTKVASAKQALLDQLKKFEEEELDRQARNFKLTINVDPEYHPKIIGRKGFAVSKLRKEHGVNIQFPQRNDEDPSLITITGYEKNCEEAKNAILTITGDLDSMIKMTVEIDHRVHARLIGQRGKSIRKIMDDYKVNISFPRNEDSPNTVTISGSETNANDCKEHLLNLEEEFMQEIRDREEMNEYAKARPRPLQFGAAFDSSNGFNNFNSEEDKRAADNWASDAPPAEPRAAPAVAAVNGTPGATVSNGGMTRQGFVVSGAPWAQEAPNMNSSEDFPSMSAKAKPVVDAPMLTSAWGPKR